MSTLYYESSFTHHGVKGMKWGVRRYQNPDGTLTKAGRIRARENEYIKPDGKFTVDGFVEMKKRVKRAMSTENSIISRDHKKALDDAYDEYSRVVEPLNTLMTDPKLVRKFGTESFRIFSEEMHFKLNMNELRDYVGSEDDYGPNSTVGLYYKSRGIPYDKFEADYKRAIERVHDASSKVATDILGSFGDIAASQTVSGNDNARSNTESQFVNMIINKALKSDHFIWDKR